MTLWNIIRDFFVQYFFGGFDSQGREFGSSLGAGFLDDAQGINPMDTNYFAFKFSNIWEDNSGVNVVYYSLGDWLSTTMTIITLIALSFFLFLVVRWLFKLTAGLFQGRG